MSAEPDSKIVRAGARRLRRHAEPELVALTMTSAPYRSSIDYIQYIYNLSMLNKQRMMGTGAATAPAACLDVMDVIFGQVLVAARPGWFRRIVVDDDVVSGKISPLPPLLFSRIASRENGDDPGRWRLHCMIAWHKVTSGSNGAGNFGWFFIKYPWPGYLQARIMHEWIPVLQKGGSRPGGSNRDRKNAIPLNRIVKRVMANSAWCISPCHPTPSAAPSRSTGRCRGGWSCC